MSDPQHLTLFLVNTATGQSESLPVAPTTSVQELAEWSKALFGISTEISLAKDGNRLQPSQTLTQAGLTNGDMIAVVADQATAQAPAPRPVAAPAGAGLDFSNLLQQAGGPSVPAASTAPPPPVYYNGMHLEDAMAYNRHPRAFCQVLLEHEVLWKQLNYHNPRLAQKLKEAPNLDSATEVWRKELVQGSISSALQQTQAFHKEQEMTSRRSNDPNDAEAKEYFEAKQRQTLVQEQFRQMMDQYPESMGRVLMLYINATINGHAIQAFCDSGAQSTIMSKKMVHQCGLQNYIDTRFHGTAVGVGTGKILGRIHMVQLQINGHYFPCTVTVMDDAGSGKEMGFLLGLDMMKRHLCQIDLEQSVLRFRLAPGQYMETPFLHEKDLDEEKGGTKGFDADKANREMMELERKAEEEEGNKKKSGDE